MVFRCRNIACTTANSQYSRTELREMLDPLNSSAKALSNNWTPEQGGWMRAKLRVDRVLTTGDSGKAGRVIVGQIHGPSTEPVRLYYPKKAAEKTGRIYIAVETPPVRPGARLTSSAMPTRVASRWAKTSRSRSGSTAPSSALRFAGATAASTR